MKTRAEVVEPRRRHRRWFVDFSTTIAVREEALNCSVHDLSPSGACLEVLDRMAIAAGDRIDFELPGYGAIPAEVRYRDDNYLGLAFLHDATGEIAAARYLVTIEHACRR